MPGPPDEFQSRHFPIQEDMPLQVRLWRIERLGWYLLALIVLLTLLGLFGTGPLSAVEARTPGGLSVKYARFERNGAATQMTVAARGEPGQAVRFTVSGDLLRYFTLDGIQPPPARAMSAGEGLGFELVADAEGRATAYLALRPGMPGLARSTLDAGGERLPIWQWIHP